MVKFSISNVDFKIEYETSGKMNENVLTFNDNSVEDTMIFLEFHKKGIVMKRTGKTVMNQTFIVDKFLKGDYHSMGIYLNIGAFTHSIELNENDLTVIYDYYLNGEKQNQNTMKISW